MLPAGYFEGGLVFAALIALSIASTSFDDWRRRRRETRRTMDMQNLATNLGFDFSAAPPPGFELPSLPLINRADRGAGAMNFVLPRRQGRVPLLFCDLKLQSSGSKGRLRTRYVTVALADYGTDFLPAFELKPETLLDKADQLLGTPDLDLDWAREFSSKFVLTGPDGAALRAFFTPPRTAALESRPGVVLQGAGRRLLISLPGPAGCRELEQEEYSAFLEEAGALAAELAP